MSFVTDPLTGAGRLVVPARAKRLGPRPDGCPFCPGNEHATPAESWRLASDDDAGWAARAFPNLYPLVPEAHEVLVPTPRHVTTIRDLTDSEWLSLAEMWIASHDRLTRDVSVDQSVLLFVNDGVAAGSSVPHVHAQIIVIPGERVGERVSRVSALGQCAVCDMSIDTDLHVTTQDSWFLAAHPCPQTPEGLVLAPLGHVNELPPVPVLAEMLSTAVRALDPDVAFNMWLICDPRTPAHWYVEIAPRFGYLAGFELALSTGVTIVDPADAATRAHARLNG